jgi:hypothetical protein
MGRPKGAKNCSNFKYKVIDSKNNKTLYYVTAGDIAADKGLGITFAFVKRRYYSPEIPNRDHPHLTFHRVEKPMPATKRVLLDAEQPDSQ